MAERDWMKGLGVQRWPGQSAQRLKENCQLGGMDSLVSESVGKPSQCLAG